MVEFRSVGNEPYRTFRVGTCKGCNAPIFDDEREGPPEEKDWCSFCKKDNKIKGRRKRRKEANDMKKSKDKSVGDRVVDLVASRHKDVRGISTLKMGAKVRLDLVAEINRAVEEAKNGKAE